MKTHSNKLSILTICLLVFFSCNRTNLKEIDSNFPYQLSISATNKTNAPALQSFVHGYKGSEWLLFAGRTNKNKDSIGGIHNLNSNYTNKSFPPASFNDSLYVYNVDLDSKPYKMHYNQVVNAAFKNCMEVIGELTIPCFQQKEIFKKNLNIFRNSNALVKQDGDYLYVVGGYGASVDSVKTKYYVTFNQVAKINVPNMIKLIKGNKLSSSELKDLVSFGKNDKLISTGGEMYKFGKTLYLSGGHNFTYSSQKYVDAVYPFTAEESRSTPYNLDITVSNPISDVPDPTAKGTDAISIFRRRDGPITPNLYKIDNTIKRGLTFYTGVFRPDSLSVKGTDSTYYHLAWNNAIYVHPKKSTSYTYDKAYNQKNFNVYSCPSFVLFDASSDNLHTFLLGGIGDGSRAPVGHLSGFTNTGVHITMNIDQLKSTHEVLDKNIFIDNAANNPPFYGAEAILFPNKSLNYFQTSNGNPTEILDISKLEGSTIDIGYVFGGIESFHSNPGTYGWKKSRASNKIWKIELKKKSN